MGTLATGQDKNYPEATPPRYGLWVLSSGCFFPPESFLLLMHTLPQTRCSHTPCRSLRLLIHSGLVVVWGRIWVGDNGTTGNLSCFFQSLGGVWDNRPEVLLREKPVN